MISFAPFRRRRQDPITLARFTVLSLAVVSIAILPCALALFGTTPEQQAWGQGPPGGKGPPPAGVYVAPVVERKDLAGSAVFVGTVMPARKSSVGSAVDGRVVEFFVNEGDRVEKDQPLAQLRTRALEIQLAAANAEVEFRTQELNELENGARPEEKEQARARMAGAKYLMEYRKSKLDRTRALFERRTASEDQLQEDESAFLNAAEIYADAKAALELVNAGPRAEKLAQAAARVAWAEEDVKRIEDQLEKHTIVSPFDGYVVREHTEIGQWISQGELVADLVEVDHVDIEVLVLEGYIPGLKLGSPARVEVTALPDEQFFTGEVTMIVPQADLRSRSFPVKVRLKNRKNEDGSVLIKPGMFARVNLPVDNRARVLMAPKDALVISASGPLLYVVAPNPMDKTKLTVRPVPVQLGVAYEDHIEVIAEALSSKDQVVIEGNERLFPGREIQIVPGGREGASGAPQAAEAPASRPPRQPAARAASAQNTGTAPETASGE